jgi:hypothetical protein
MVYLLKRLLVRVIVMPGEKQRGGQKEKGKGGKEKMERKQAFKGLEIRDKR